MKPQLSTSQRNLQVDPTGLGVTVSTDSEFEYLVDGATPEPNLEVRLHSPTREVVVVRVGGMLDTLSAPLLAERVGQQLSRAPHVVIDLGDVTSVTVAGVAALSCLHRQAMEAGTQLHLAAEHDTVRQALHVAELDQLFPIAPTAAAVLACLEPVDLTRTGGSRGDTSSRRARRGQRTRRSRWDG
ncbi:MAG: STAS domain-containing protein [Pseudonocardia sp.]